MSIGVIWYKTHPESSIARAIDIAFSAVYGKSVIHNATVRPNKVALMIKQIFSRSNTAVIVGGLTAIKPEENIVFMLSRALDIPIESGALSRSDYCYDTIRGIKLPSLDGSILFPTRFGGPEGILLKAGKQTIIVLPSEPKAAQGIISSIAKFVAPTIRAEESVRAKTPASSNAASSSAKSDDYRKFKQPSANQYGANQAATKVYSEQELQKSMEEAVYTSRLNANKIPESFSDDYNRGQTSSNSAFLLSKRKGLRELVKNKSMRNISSLVLVLGVIVSIVIFGNFVDISTFASSIASDSSQASDENYVEITTSSATTTTTTGESLAAAIVTTESESTTSDTTASESTTAATTTTASTTTTAATSKTTASTTTTSKKSTTTATTVKSTTTTAKTTTTTKAATTTKTTTKAATTTTAKSTTTTTTTTTKAATTTTTTAASSSLTMRITTNGSVVSGDAVTILASIIEAEMGSSYNLEALKAQAVAAYTYYLYCGGSSKAPSFPTKTPGTKAKTAAKAVVGQKMTYNGKTPYTPYYAISAGMTAANSTINGTSLAYLVSVDSSSDKNASGYKKSYTYSASQVAKKVKNTTGIDLTSISDKNSWFTIVERDSNGLYVEKVKVGSKTYRGSKLRLSILGSSYLRSACYYISYDSSSDSFTFTSYGYGHGVGMSQTAANYYASQGKGYKWILTHFYSGVTVS